MKLIKFGSRNSFIKWFYSKDRNIDYPLVDLNFRHCWEEDTHIYRAVDDKKDIGVIFISCCYPEEMWIDLFEIKDGNHKKGFGTEMFQLLMEKHKPCYIKLECVEEYDEEKEAHHFWKKMGFHKTREKYLGCEVFKKTYKKKYWKEYDKLFAANSR